MHKNIFIMYVYICISFYTNEMNEFSQFFQFFRETRSTNNKKRMHNKLIKIVLSIVSQLWMFMQFIFLYET